MENCLRIRGSGDWEVGLPEMVPPAATRPYGDIKNRPQVPGQGSDTPSEKCFIVHRIIEATAPDSRIMYYDPSYGITYTGPADIINTAIDGCMLGILAQDNLPLICGAIPVDPARHEAVVT
jgi:hypothetical protein